MADKPDSTRPNFWGLLAEAVAELTSVVRLYSVGVSSNASGGNSHSPADGAGNIWNAANRNRVVLRWLLLAVFVAHGSVGILALVGWDGLTEVLHEASYTDLVAAGISAGSIAQVLAAIVLSIVFALCAYLILQLAAFLVAAIILLLDLLVAAALVVAQCADALSTAAPPDRYHFQWSRTAAGYVNHWPNVNRVNYVVLAGFVICSFVLLSMRNANPLLHYRSVLPPIVASWVDPEAWGLTAPTVTLCLSGNQCDAVTVTTVLQTSRTFFVVPPKGENASLAASQCRRDALISATEPVASSGANKLSRFSRENIKAVLSGGSEAEREFCRKVFGQRDDLQKIAKSMQEIASKIPVDGVPPTTTLLGLLDDLKGGVNRVDEKLGALKPIAGTPPKFACRGTCRERGPVDVQATACTTCCCAGDGPTAIGSAISTSVQRIEARLDRITQEVKDAIFLGGVYSPENKLQAALNRLLCDAPACGPAARVATLPTIQRDLHEIKESLGRPKDDESIAGRLRKIDGNLAALTVMPPGQHDPALRSLVVNKPPAQVPVTFKEPVEVRHAEAEGVERATMHVHYIVSTGSWSSDHNCNDRSFRGLQVNFDVDSYAYEPTRPASSTGSSARSNADAITAIAAEIKRLVVVDGRVSHFLLLGEAAAEGPAGHNINLSRARAGAVCKELANRIKAAKPVRCENPLTGPAPRPAPASAQSINIVAAPLGEGYEYWNDHKGSTERRVRVLACYRR